ncbi:MAG: hypothetical protein HQ562_05655 [Candidatus Marinimicrobia bacterium]|nr:hypothetical protein [Candidatus Neomarinimicrobiota bacterium]
MGTFKPTRGWTLKYLVGIDRFLFKVTLPLYKFQQSNTKYAQGWTVGPGNS